MEVQSALDGKAAISAINWAEVLTKLTDIGGSFEDMLRLLARFGIPGNQLLVWPADEILAVEIARLRSLTRAEGLSLGDRACLALALQLNLPVLTADRIWTKVKCGVSVQLIR